MTPLVLGSNPPKVKWLVFGAERDSHCGAYTIDGAWMRAASGGFIDSFPRLLSPTYPNGQTQKMGESFVADEEFLFFDWAQPQPIYCRST